MRKKALKSVFVSLPLVLKKQILILYAVGAMGLFLTMLTYLVLKDVLFSAGVAIVTLSGAARGIWLTVQYLKRKYVLIHGTCVRIDTSGKRKRKRYLYLQTGTGIVRIPARPGHEVISEGDEVDVYLSGKTPVYEKDGIILLMGYYALDVRKTDSNRS